MLFIDLWSGLDQIRIEKRRSGLLKKMLRLVEKPESFDDTSTPIDLAILTVAENIIGDLTAMRSHQAGLRTWFSSNGGMQRLHSSSIHPSSAIIIMSEMSRPSFPLFRTHSELKAALDRLRLPHGQYWPSVVRRCKICFKFGDLYMLYLLNHISEQAPQGLLDDIDGSFPEEGLIGFVAAQYAIEAAIRKHHCSDVCDYAAVLEFVHLMRYTSSAAQLRTAAHLIDNLCGVESTQPVDTENLRIEVDMASTANLDKPRKLSWTGITEKTVVTYHQHAPTCCPERLHPKYDAANGTCARAALPARAQTSVKMGLNQTCSIKQLEGGSMQSAVHYECSEREAMEARAGLGATRARYR
jgi:hypothetical protein